MICNCQGVSNNTFKRVARDLFFSHKLDIVANVELRISCSKAVEVIKKPGFQNFNKKDAHGFSSGSWIFLVRFSNQSQYS